MDIVEEWKQIEGFERYYISNLGNIKSTIGKEKILNKYISTTGYYIVKLRKDNKSYNRFIHRLVAIAFIETDNKHKDVHHKNSNRLDNNVNNLQWVTREEHRKLHSQVSGALCCTAESLDETKRRGESNNKNIVCGSPSIETID